MCQYFLPNVRVSFLSFFFQSFFLLLFRVSLLLFSEFSSLFFFHNFLPLYLKFSSSFFFQCFNTLAFQISLLFFSNFSSSLFQSFPPFLQIFINLFCDSLLAFFRIPFLFSIFFSFF